MKRVPKPILEKITSYTQYPRTQELGVEVYFDQDLAYVKWKELRRVLRKKGIARKFNKYFGIQTCYADGPYAHDVEAVLERIKSGILTGSQKDWD
jgi:hypothetical protein